MFWLRIGSWSNGTHDVQVEATDDGARITWPDGRDATVSWSWLEDHTVPDGDDGKRQE